VRDLSVVGVQGKVIGGKEKNVLDHSCILSLELHRFELSNLVTPVVIRSALVEQS